MAIATSVLGIDDPQLRVTTWTFAADGDETGHHVHECDYLVVPVTGGSFAVAQDDGGTRTLPQVAGTPYRGTAGTSHNVINASGGRAQFVEVEFKA
jgi:hypothetical protein